MRDRHKRAASRVCAGAREIVNELSRLGARSGHNTARIWDDWISSMALALSNSCDRRPAVWEAREAEYMEIVARHGAEVMAKFKAMFFGMVDELEAAYGEYSDLLGGIYMGLEMGNDARGQFFTPDSLCQVMAATTITHDAMHAHVEKDGFFTLCDPAIGGGATEVLRAGLNPAEHLHITGVDIDQGVLRMCYVQLAIMGAAATLQVGDTLRMQMREGGDYYTPIHIINGW
jgi:hypothetical protein